MIVETQRRIGGATGRGAVLTIRVSVQTDCTKYLMIGVIKFFIITYKHMFYL